MDVLVVIQEKRYRSTGTFHFCKNWVWRELVYIFQKGMRVQQKKRGLALMLPRKVYSLAQKVLEMRRWAPSEAHVYMLHEVYGDVEAVQEPNLAVHIERFARWVDTLAERMRPLSALSEKGAVVLTFDDVFASAGKHALPLLMERQIPFTLFISPCFLDRPGYIETQQLREFSASPLCTVGAHSMTHCRMRPLPEQTVRREMMEIRRFFGRPVGQKDTILCLSLRQRVCLFSRECSHGAGGGIPIRFFYHFWRRAQTGFARAMAYASHQYQ